MTLRSSYEAGTENNPTLSARASPERVLCDDSRLSDREEQAGKKMLDKVGQHV